MSKSIGNLYTIEDVIARGIHPLALRLYYFHSSYRNSLNFNWEHLLDYQKILLKLYEAYLDCPSDTGVSFNKQDMQRFSEAMNDDLNTAKALSVVIQVLNKSSSKEKKATLLKFDEILQCRLIFSKDFLEEIDRYASSLYSDEKVLSAKKLLFQRDAFRKDSRYEEADNTLKKIQDLGFDVKDFPDVSKLIRKKNHSL